MTQAELETVRVALIFAATKYDEVLPNRPDFEGALMAVQRTIERHEWFSRELKKAVPSLAGSI